MELYKVRQATILVEWSELENKLVIQQHPGITFLILPSDIFLIPK